MVTPAFKINSKLLAGYIAVAAIANEAGLRYFAADLTKA